MIAEEAALGRAVDKRRREFTTGRNCARSALAMLGLPAQPILPGPGRQPLWPSGIAGSIAHCHGFCAAAAARQDQLAAVGIDAELNQPLPQEVLHLVLLEAERRWVQGMFAAGISWDTVLFSAKESAFKAMFTLTGTRLELGDVCIAADPDNRTFRAGLRADGTAGCDMLRGLEGRYAVDDGHIYTSAVVWRESRYS